MARGGGEARDHRLHIQSASFEPIDRVEAVLIAVADLSSAIKPGHRKNMVKFRPMFFPKNAH